MFLYFDRVGSKIQDDYGHVYARDDFDIPTSYKLRLFDNVPCINHLLHLLMSDKLVLEEPVKMTEEGIKGTCYRDMRLAKKDPLYNAVRLGK